MNQARTYLHQTTAMLLLVLFLVSSIGFNITNYTCQITGKKEAALFTQPLHLSCCSKEKATMPSRDCCNKQAQYVKLDVVKKVEESSHVKLSLAFIPLFTLLLHLIGLQPQTVGTIASAQSPPDIGGRGILTLVQVFRL